ncbi:aminotransferase class V-fold PLP-dependent enzyme [Aliamphritea ceti]|uniref:aminotransferase class V-fold PLP-dependent enzyme n=1 Tax=Aliamphritea ceti TaxID=1524258 RepID=UPI0021C38E2A|nr:aminotransferase class V-fold PLP-dependent enzyme [Aliamphritea ceti]
MTALIQRIRDAVIGSDQTITTPFGDKPLVYADYTASGRSLNFIEEYIQQQVLPFYANTHTESSYTGAQTGQLREQARTEIRQAVNADDTYEVIFCGSGATAAIHKLVDILNLRLPADLNDRYKFTDMIPQDQRPVVFIGAYEHHSNELPWRESIADVVVIPLSETGLLDIQVLEEKLVEYQNRPLKIGSFSAASNVTGLKSNVVGISHLLKRFGAFAFWDYAAGAPYVGIDMLSGGKPDSALDAVFISPHKFIGGPGTPGILVVNKALLTNRVPAVPGGGTVIYVTPEDHSYTEHGERREEGGTPAIIESIRAGLVFRLQQQVGVERIEKLETDFVRRALQHWGNNDKIEVLGNPDAPRLSIVSLRIKYQQEDLHYGFVVALLNDLFGIQARGGCSCAGPYGHALLDMDMQYSKAVEAQIKAAQMVMRPGWSRLNFNYFIDEACFQYLLQAIDLVAEHGWRLLPFYQYDTASGVWKYQGQGLRPAVNLQDLDFMDQDQTERPRPTATDIDYAGLLQQAEDVLLQEQQGQRFELSLPADAEALRWFVLPQAIEI